MVKMFRIVCREIRGLHQAVYILALFTVGSQLLALIRDRLLAHKFGAGTELDLYYAAFQIPDLLFVLFASTLSVYVLIPFVAARMDDSNAAASKLLLSRIFSLFLITYTTIALLLLLCAPYLVPVLFPGLAEHNETLTLLVRILLLQPLFLGISSLCGVVTQLHKRFVLYALSPLIYNLGIIFGIIFLLPTLGLPGLAVGVVLGAVGHLLIQLPFILGSNLAPTLTTNIDNNEIKAVLKTSMPRAITLSLNQLVLFVLISVASTMTVGSVTVFQLAYNLQSAPLLIVGVSYSVAAFPLLAQLYSRRDLTRFREQLITALKHIIFWTVPALGLLLVLRAQLVRVVLGSGEFDWSDTRLTAAVLALFAISLTAQAVSLLLVRAFYAGGDTRTPFFISLATAVLALGSALLFYHLYLTSPWLAAFFTTLMRVPEVVGTEILVLALGYTLALFIQAVCLLFFIRRRYQLSLGWLPAHLARAVSASLSGALVAYFVLNLAAKVVDINTFVGVFSQGFLAGIAGLATAALVYYLTKAPELFEICQSLRGRLNKVDSKEIDN